MLSMYKALGSIPEPYYKRKIIKFNIFESFFFETGPRWAQILYETDDFELLIILLPPLGCWDYMHVHHAQLMKP